MTNNRQDETNNVIAFQPRQVSASDERRQRDDILRLLDLSKFEEPRRAVEPRNDSMTANIAAILLLGLLVFAATEGFGVLERSNLCTSRQDCRY